MILNNQSKVASIGRKAISGPLSDDILGISIDSRLGSLIIQVVMLRSCIVTKHYSMQESLRYKMHFVYITTKEGRRLLDLLNT